MCQIFYMIINLDSEIHFLYIGYITGVLANKNPLTSTYSFTLALFMHSYNHNRHSTISTNEAWNMIYLFLQVFRL